MIRTILNVKGGVGKTTTTINLAGGFAQAGKKTLVIDFDGQANLTRLLTGRIFSEDEKTVVNALLKECPIEECIYPTTIENLDIIPSNIYLFTIEKQMLLNSGAGIQQFKLKNILQSIINQYDEIIIDNNPSLNLCATNSLCACDELIIPACLDIGAMDGIKMTLAHCMEILEGIEGVEFDFRILVTMMNRSTIERDELESLNKQYDHRLYLSKIRYQAKPVRNAGKRTTLLINDTKSNVAQDYRDFIDEVLKGEN